MSLKIEYKTFKNEICTCALVRFELQFVEVNVFVYGIYFSFVFHMKYSQKNFCDQKMFYDLFRLLPVSLFTLLFSICLAKVSHSLLESRK